MAGAWVCVGMFFGMICSYIMDKVGRRPLLIWPIVSTVWLFCPRPEVAADLCTYTQFAAGLMMVPANPTSAVLSQEF